MSALVEDGQRSGIIKVEVLDAFRKELALWIRHRAREDKRGEKQQIVWRDCEPDDPPVQPPRSLP